MAAPKPDEVMEEFFMAGTEPVDVAEPAALPAGDALLELYGDGDEKLPSEQAPGAEPGDLMPVAETPTASGPRPKGLPSVTDEPD